MTPQLPAASRFFHPLSVPPSSRANYRHELVSVAFTSIVVACISGGVMGVIAKKAFDAGDLVVTILAGSEAISNITSLWWTRILHARHRVRATVILQSSTLACAAAIALAPFNSAGIAVILAATLLARTFLTGIISARADLWRANYPRHDRGRITGKLAILATLVASLFALLIALLMDLPITRSLGGHTFRPLYAAAALAGVIGVASFSRVRWRGGAAHLRLERSTRLHHHHPTSPDDRDGRGARAMIAVLRQDHDYRRFMTAQFVLGAPNIAITPIFIIALKDHFTLGYTQSIALTQIIETLTPIFLIPLWARLLDRMHIIRFRAYHSWVFVLANLMLAAAFLTENLPLLYASKVVLGVGLAGGMLAWNLGHHDFAAKGLATLYMGIHVTLTGVRGVVAPFLGLLLYSPWSLSVAGLRFHWPGLGPWTFLLLAAFTILGAAHFVLLHKSTRARINASPLRD